MCGSASVSHPVHDLLSRTHTLCRLLPPVNLYLTLTTCTISPCFYGAPSLRDPASAHSPTPLESINSKLIDSKQLASSLSCLKSTLTKTRARESNQLAIPPQTPSPFMISGRVFTKILKSIPKLQFSIYSKSSFIFVSNEGSRRAVTCHKPVIPGFTSSLRKCSSV